MILVLFCGLFQRHNILLLLSSKRLVLIVVLLENFSTHLFCDFHPFHVGKYFSSVKPRPQNFHFHSRKVSSHCCNVSLSSSRLSKTILSSTLSACTHIHVQLLQDHPIFPYDFLRLSCENFSLVLPLVVREEKSSLHTFLSEDDLVVSLLAVIRSGYPVFSKQRPRSFTYSVCYCLISEIKNYSREIFSS